MVTIQYTELYGLYLWITGVGLGTFMFLYLVSILKKMNKRLVAIELASGLKEEEE